MVWVENFVEIKIYSEEFIKGFGWSGLGANFAAVCARPVLARFAGGWQVVAITLTARVKFIWPDHTEPTKCFAPRVTAPSIPGGNAGGTGGAK